MQFLTDDQIGQMSPEQIKLLGGSVISLTSHQLATIAKYDLLPIIFNDLTAPQIGSLDLASLAKVPSLQIELLNGAQMVYLTQAQIKSLLSRSDLSEKTIASLQILPAASSTTQIKSYFTPHTSLGLKSTHADVKKLQDFLTVLDFSVVNNDAPGTFGPDTKRAVQKLQKRSRLKIDGIFKGDTVTKANRLVTKSNAVNKDHAPQPSFSPATLLHQGDRGEHVTNLQNFLVQRDILDAYGTFGPATHEAVKHFQRTNNLTATGIFDGKTVALANQILAKITKS